MRTPASEPASPVLQPAQLQALQAVQSRGASRCNTAPLAPIHIHFHADWLHGGQPVMARLAASGRYQSQFESGRSNGSYSPQSGGQRWQWEHDWFAGAYDSSAPNERPVYGAVDLTPLGHACSTGYGAAPRFGSAYLVLHPQLAMRSSFCDPESYWQPTHVGLWPQMDWQQLRCLALPDPLDHYVEAQIHGGLVLARDVAAIVLDPSLAGSPAAVAATRCGVPVRWHGGYRLTAAKLTDAAAYRGAEIADALQDMLARPDGAEHQCLTPATLARAQAAHPSRYEGAILKKAWHCMARFGRAM